ncbi:hypothetical protein [Caballeronia grimmiae]|uniref:hypothetical protein n=1 Tax=Caballeronia grimmiae TaxID=1071679 RepID=UPI0038B87482
MPVEGANAAASSASGSFSRSGSFIDRLPRVLFIVTVLYGAALFWIAARPPLADLPQHAGQVMLLRDLLGHASPWSSFVRINLFTPYLIGYGLALPLTYLMPVAAAIKLLMMIAYFGFVASCIGFRKHLNGDSRLDILFVPGFFGFAFGWGFRDVSRCGACGHPFHVARSSLCGGSVIEQRRGNIAGRHGALFLSRPRIPVRLCDRGLVCTRQATASGVDGARARAVRAARPAVHRLYDMELCGRSRSWSFHRELERPGLGWTDRAAKRLIALPVLVWSASREGAYYLPVSS